jgi:hypothetical protein
MDAQMISKYKDVQLGVTDEEVPIGLSLTPQARPAKEDLLLNPPLTAGLKRAYPARHVHQVLRHRS